MSVRNTCSLLLSGAQFILLRSLRSSKPCESSEHTFSFVENCKNHRCSVGKSSQRTASTSYLWHGHTHKKEAQKKKEEKEPEKGRVHPRESTPLLFLPWTKKSGEFAQRRSLSQPPFQELAPKWNLFLSSAAANTIAHRRGKESVSTPISWSKDPEGGRGWECVRMFHKSTLDPLTAVMLQFTQILPALYSSLDSSAELSPLV